MKNTEMENGLLPTLGECKQMTFLPQTVGVSDSHAKTLASQESKQDFKEIVQACFSELCTFLDKSQKKRDPIPYSLRMLKICLALMEDGISPGFSLKWTGGGYDAEWQVLNSKYHGVPQNRERCFIIGHFRGRSRSEIFPVEGTNGADCIRGVGHRGGYRRNTQIFDREGITEALDTAAGGGRGHHTIETIGHVRPDAPIADRNRILGEGGGIAEPDGNGVQGTIQSGCELVGNTNPSGKGMNGNCYSADGVNPTLATNKGEGGRIAIPVLTPERANKRQNGRRFKEDGDPAFTLTGQDRHGVAIGVIDDQGRTQKKCDVKETVPTLRSESHGNQPKVVVEVDDD